MPGGPPNLLWIITTQWRAQALGCAGDPNARTPRLDAFAAEGLHCTQAVTPHPFGPFARAALLTGVPSPRNGVREYFDPLPAGGRTVAHGLSQRGYRTAFFGKWHLGLRDPAAALVGEAHARMIVPPAMRGGFQFWEGFESGFLLNDPWLHGTRLPEPVQFRGYQSRVVCERAAEWLSESGAGGQPSPLFAVVSLEAPHPPYLAPADGIAVRSPAELTLAGNVPRGGEVEARARRELAGYYAHIEATDRAIGGLIDRVDRSRTTVVFTSVHGDMHGAHGRFRKGWPHEESVRVPLLVLAAGEPGVAPAGPCHEPVSLLDLPRWALGWAEGAPPGSRPGPARRIASPYPSIECQLIGMPSVVPLPDQCDRVWCGARSASRKLILNEDGSPWLFFDLEEDPLERCNLADRPERAGEIAAWRDVILSGRADDAD